MDIEKLDLVDLHCHVVPCVDDGSMSLDESIKMIEEEMKNGVHTIICTPHFRKGMFEADYELIENNFLGLKEEINKRNLNVEIYLGREIYINSMNGSLERTIDRINNNVVQSINGTKHFLFEFSYTHEIEIGEIAYTLITKGIQPIIAHVERYKYVNDLESIRDIKSVGAMIQINASAVVGSDGHSAKKFVWSLLKNNLVDVIASDYHFNRSNDLYKAYTLVRKKLGEEVANNLFKNNPKSVLK